MESTTLNRLRKGISCSEISLNVKDKDGDFLAIRIKNEEANELFEFLITNLKLKGEDNGK